MCRVTKRSDATMLPDQPRRTKPSSWHRSGFPRRSQPIPSPDMPATRLFCPLAVALGCLSSCVSWHEEHNVRITSEPAGARIVVNDVDTGYTTPRVLAIGGLFSTDQTVRLEKVGFHPATRTLYQQREGYSSKWIDGAFDLVMPPMPLFWTTGDVFAPLGVRGALLPRELHARLRPSDTPLLGFDLLEQRASAKSEEPGQQR